MEQSSILSKAYNCDCLEYMKSLPDNYFDLAIADPPYGIGASKPSKKPSNILQKNGSIMSASVTDFGKKDWDNNIPTQEFFDELRRVSKNQIIWGANYFGLQGGMIVWDKINGNSDQYDCEIAYQSFNKRTDLVHYMWNGMFQGKYCGRDIRQAAVQQGNKTLNEKRIHPTQKPVILYEWLLNNYAKKGDRIFDPMMGSQSSRIAAYRLGFDYVGCELDKEYYDKGCSRFNQTSSNLKNNDHYNNAKQAIRDRITNSWQRSFTPEQVVILKRYLDLMIPPKNSLGITPSFYEGMITPDSKTIFVFGSNPEGIHGAGAAKFARDRFGAVYGFGEGLQGSSYALPTKDLRVAENKGYRSIPEKQIIENIRKMYQTALEHPDKLFKVAYTHGLNEVSLNGYTGAEMISMFKEAGPIPDNVMFSKNWTEHWNDISTKSAKVAFRDLLDEVVKESDVARKPEKWVTDTAKELNNLAEGITREESRGLHK